MHAIDRVSPRHCREKIKTLNLSQFLERRSPESCAVASAIKCVCFDVKRLLRQLCGKLPSRRRLKKKPMRAFSLSNAVVVFPLPAAPLIRSTPGRVRERIFNCSGVAVTFRRARM